MRLNRLLPVTALSLCALNALQGQSPVEVPAAAPATVSTPAAKPTPDRMPQSVADYYNNNPIYPLTLGATTPRWTKNLTEEGLKIYNPLFLQDRILLGEGKWLYSLDPSTGQITWKQQFERDVDTFQADGDLLIYSDHRFGLMGGKSWVHAYSLKEKKQLWEQDSYLGTGVQFYDAHAYHFTLNVLGGFTLHSFDLQGKAEWTVKLKGRGNLFFFDDLVVTAPPGTKRILAFRRKDGSEAWNLPLEEDAWEMAYHDGVFYNTQRSHYALGLPGGTITVTATDLRKGKQAWTFTTSADDGWIPEKVGGIVSNGRYCVLNTNRRLIGIDATTGQQLWIAATEDKQTFLPAKPILLNNEAFAVQTHKNDHSILQFLDLATGKETRRLEASDEILPPVKVVGRSLFVCFRHGDMMALPLVDPTEAPTPVPATAPEPAPTPVQGSGH